MGAYGSPETYPYPKDAQNQSKASKTPKPFYKCAWFWAGLAMLAIALIGGGVSTESLLVLAGMYCAYGFVHHMVMFLYNMWKNRNFKHNLLIALSCVVMFGVFGVALNESYPGVPQPAINLAQPFALQLTSEIYDSLQKGMAYPDVCNLIGAEGTLYQESGFGETATKAYYWGTSEKNIYAGFIDGKLYDKGRVGMD